MRSLIRQLNKWGVEREEALLWNANKRDASLCAAR